LRNSPVSIQTNQPLKPSVTGIIGSRRVTVSDLRTPAESSPLINRKIGDNMGLTESSVKNVVQQLFRKAGVKTRSQLVRVALEGSLVTATGPTP